MMTDMDNHGEWKLVTKEQIEKTVKSERELAASLYMFAEAERPGSTFPGGFLTGTAAFLLGVKIMVREPFSSMTLTVKSCLRNGLINS
jgi:hypothetical protein